MAPVNPNEIPQETRRIISVPDPSTLTMEALERETQHLREILESKVNDSAHLTDRRFEDGEKALGLLERSRDQLRSLTENTVDRGIANVQELIVAKVLDLQHMMEAELRSLRQGLSDQDRRFEQSKIDSKAAIDAALQAAKEAVGKTETVTDKQIAGLQSLITSIQKNYDDKLDALKDRFNDERNRIQSVQAIASSAMAGTQGVTLGERQAQQRFYATIAVIATVIGVIITLIVFAINNTGA